MTSLMTLKNKKRDKEKISALAIYDATLAGIAAKAGVEILLVGDSLGMVIQGHSDTLKVTLDDMAYHTGCVARANCDSFIIADMPFASYTNPEQSTQSAAKLMRAGAHMVKIEGGSWLQPSIASLNEQGIPVCGHLGLTPQSIHTFGGYGVHGKTAEEADAIMQSAIELERAGAALLVLECVPSSLGRIISVELSIPVIGIGAGVDTDGQVLVAYDMLGLSIGHMPRFVKNFLQDCSCAEQAMKTYVHDVKNQRFPALEHSYS